MAIERAVTTFSLDVSATVTPTETLSFDDPVAVVRWNPRSPKEPLQLLVGTASFLYSYEWAVATSRLELKSQTAVGTTSTQMCGEWGVDGTTFVMSVGNSLIGYVLDGFDLIEKSETFVVGHGNIVGIESGSNPKGFWVLCEGQLSLSEDEEDQDKKEEKKTTHEKVEGGSAGTADTPIVVSPPTGGARPLLDAFIVSRPDAHAAAAPKPGCICFAQLDPTTLAIAVREVIPAIDQSLLSSMIALEVRLSLSLYPLMWLCFLARVPSANIKLLRRCCRGGCQCRRGTCCSAWHRKAEAPYSELFLLHMRWAWLRSCTLSLIRRTLLQSVQDREARPWCEEGLGFGHKGDTYAGNCMVPK